MIIEIALVRNRTQERIHMFMKKEFNVTGACIPELHYMVDITKLLEVIREYVDKGKYFVINRARQYGKTTTLQALREYLKDDYVVVSMDFQRLDSAKYQDGNVFSLAFASYFLRALKAGDKVWMEPLKEKCDELARIVREQLENFTLFELFEYLGEICGLSRRPIVLMIDEVDSASDYQVFLDFLSQLRADYLDRKNAAAFHSVILAGVYDIKNIRRKIRTEDEHKRNSPWNVAADFDVDMSLPEKGIARMLAEYEEDFHTGMDIDRMASMIYDYTSGYPFLVSRICKLTDERVAGSADFPDKSAAWTKEGIWESVRLILSEENSLFDSLMEKVDRYQELNDVLFTVLFTGKTIAYNSDSQAVSIAAMFGFVKNANGSIAIANRIFETRLYNRYLASEDLQKHDIYQSSLWDKNQFVIGGYLNMQLILEKFVLHFHDLYADSDERFVEECGRRLFLLYLRPIINGTGNYYIESRTRSMGRTDVIVDYRGEQHVIEMKIWRGQEYNRRGEEQIIGYLDAYHLRKGYMLSFCFHKKKQVGVKEIIIGDKKVIEAVV